MPLHSRSSLLPCSIPHTTGGKAHSNSGQLSVPCMNCWKYSQRQVSPLWRCPAFTILVGPSCSRLHHLKQDAMHGKMSHTEVHIAQLNGVRLVFILSAFSIFSKAFFPPALLKSSQSTWPSSHLLSPLASTAQSRSYFSSCTSSSYQSSSTFVMQKVSCLKPSLNVQ